MKPIVHYHGEPLFGPGWAYVWPLDHPSELVSNTKMVRTSMVVVPVNEAGTFETENTVYKKEVPNASV